MILAMAGVAACRNGRMFVGPPDQSARTRTAEHRDRLLSLLKSSRSGGHRRPDCRAAAEHCSGSVPRCYLRFHHTETPEKITISGRKITLVRNRTRMAAPVTCRRRSSGFFRADRNQILIGREPVHHVQRQVAVGHGRRMMIRCDSQFELPTTMIRPCFDAGPDGGCRAQNKRSFLRFGEIGFRDREFRIGQSVTVRRGGEQLLRRSFHIETAGQREDRRVIPITRVIGCCS